MGNIGTITGTGEIIQNTGGTTKHICRLSFTSDNRTFRATIIVPKTVQTVSNLYNYIRHNSDCDYATSSGSYYFKAATVYYCDSPSFTGSLYQCVIVNREGSSMSIRIGATYGTCYDVTATFEDL